MHNYQFLKFFKWLVNLTQMTFSESTRQMLESTWQMQMIHSGDGGKTQSLSQINRIFFRVEDNLFLLT